MSVEAALLLPVALTLLMLLLQPVCVFYTRSVMASAAGEVCRLAVTSQGSDSELRAYALRRLAAVPDMSIFHEGGASDWDVEVSGPDEQGAVSVAIQGRVRPLPLLGALAFALGTQEDGLLVVRVETEGSMRASWVRGDYDDWIEMWG